MSLRYVEMLTDRLVNSAWTQAGSVVQIPHDLAELWRKGRECRLMHPTEVEAHLAKSTAEAAPIEQAVKAPKAPERAVARPQK